MLIKKWVRQIRSCLLFSSFTSRVFSFTVCFTLLILCLGKFHSYLSQHYEIYFRYDVLNGTRLMVGMVGVEDEVASRAGEGLARES